MAEQLIVDLLGVLLYAGRREVLRLGHQPIEHLSTEPPHSPERLSLEQRRARLWPGLPHHTRTRIIRRPRRPTMLLLRSYIRLPATAT